MELVPDVPDFVDENKSDYEDDSDSDDGQTESDDNESDDDESDDDESDYDESDDETIYHEAQHENNVQQNQSMQHERVYVKNPKTLPKVNALIECKFPNYEQIVKCKILSKAGKVSTANWHFLNIQEYGEEAGKCCSFKGASWRYSSNAAGAVNED